MKIIYNKIKAARELGLNNRQIKKLFTGRGLGSSSINMLLRGKFVPVNYSKSRFEKKIETIKKDQKRRGLDKQQILQKSFFYPKREFDKVIRKLKRDSLDQPFFYDVPKEPAGISSLPVSEPVQVSQAPAKPVTPPLPEQPQPVLQASMPQINPTTGLTPTETALLSPDEQAIRQRQRT